MEAISNSFTWTAAVIAVSGVFLSLVLFYFKRQTAIIERKLLEEKLDALKKESTAKDQVYTKVYKMTDEISSSISEKLIDNPTWLDKFMDQTGVTYRASVYGKRIGHFYYEKKLIAEKAVEKIEEYLLEKNKDKFDKLCLLIDSGTTLYPVFQEIAKKVQANKELWKDRVFIVTNNIPGLQYFMKYAKEDINDDYSEIIINCYIIPGKPLAVYSAITGQSSEHWLKSLGPGLIEDWSNDQKIHVIGFVTGNYFARCKDQYGKPSFHPAARGEGHIEVKKAMVEKSQEIFLLAPLMKFSFANINILNEVNGFTVGRLSPEALQRPREVKYEGIEIPINKCKFFSTRRVVGNNFYSFSTGLNNDLEGTYGENNIIMPEFDIGNFIKSISDSPYLQLEWEIPHENLRTKYEKAKENIWDRVWVDRKDRKLKCDFS